MNESINRLTTYAMLGTIVEQHAKQREREFQVALGNFETEIVATIIDSCGMLRTGKMNDAEFGRRMLDLSEDLRMVGASMSGQSAKPPARQPEEREKKERPKPKPKPGLSSKMGDKFPEHLRQVEKSK